MFYQGNYFFRHTKAMGVIDYGGGYKDVMQKGV